MTDISAQMLQLAIDLYLQNAYTTTPIPTAVQERVKPIRALPPDAPVPENLLEHETAVSRSGYALRLGQPLYPHMKLIIEDAPARPSGDPAVFFPRFLLRVDAHDRHLHAPPGSPDAAWLASIRTSNKDLTDRIEGAWSDAHLPTFKEFLRLELQSRRSRHP